MKKRTATCCSWLRCVFAALILIGSHSVSHAQAGALTFSEAAQQFVAVPNFHTLGVTTEVTVEFWARFTTTAPDQTAFGLAPDAPGNRVLAHLWGLADRIYWDFGDIGNGGRVSFPNSGGPTAGWTHYAFVASQSGNFMKIFIDGAEAAALASFNAFEIAVASSLMIGGGAGDFFNGSIDDFRVWNVVRTSAQIAAARTATLAGNESGLRLYFKFDEASGNSAINSATATGTAYNGALNNAPTRIRIHTVTSTANSGPGTLRQAVLDAATGDSIFFDSTVFATAQTITLTTGEIALNKSITIDGAARSSQVTISGGNASRIFFVNSGQTVTLESLTLTGGNGTGAGFSNSGGAIDNSGTLMLTQCTLAGNSVTGFGGAISNLGPLELTQCTLSGNSASYGGAIHSELGANNSLALTQCTLSGNSADYGGAILNYHPLTLTHCTLSGNSASVSGGAIYQASDRLTLTNSVVSGSIASPDDIFNGAIAILTRVGANIVQSLDDAGSSDGSGTISNAAPQLAPLGNYGGPTQTMPPLAGSPAIDAVPAGSAVAGLTTDQRGVGFPRVLDGDGSGGALADIGAVEVRRVFVTTAVDELDTPPNAQTSLREAIRGNIADFIGFATGLNGGTITLDAAKGEIVFGKGMIIDASGLSSGVTIDGGPGANRIFFVNSGQTVALKGLTLTGGNASSGGAIFNNAGTLTLAQCTLTNSSANDFGGAIFNLDGGTLALTHCTLSSNSAGYGGALYNRGALTLTHCTVSGNFAPFEAGAIINWVGTLTLTNSIVAGSVAPSPGDIFNRSLLTRVGANIVQSFTNNGAQIGSGTISNAAPLLAPLGNYGGSTPTMALLPGSPARNAAAVLAPALTGDQRGFPIVGTPDIGAYEAGTFTNYNAWIWESLPTAGNGTINDPLHAASFDFDGDGVTNGNEWPARTDPGDPASYFRITQTTHTGNTVSGTLSLTFPSVIGRTYVVESSTDLTAWAPVSSARAGTGNLLTVAINYSGSFPRFFVRARVGP